jgi:hypothetical protein
MSRYTETNDRYTFVYGLDHWVGPFFQVYGSNKDVPLIVCDKMGIRPQITGVDNLLIECAEELKPFEELIVRFDRLFNIARILGVDAELGALQINAFAEASGFNNLVQKIYGVLDEAP